MLLVAFLLLVVMPGAALVASLLLVAMPFATSSLLAPSSDARSGPSSVLAPSLGPLLASLLGARRLLVAKGIATRSKDATRAAPGITTRSKKATSSKGHRY